MAAISPITVGAAVPDLWDKAVEALKEKDKQNVNFQHANKRAILVDVLEEVQRKKQRCIDQRLKYRRSNGESVHLYDVFEKIVKWVNKFKEVGDVAVQYDPGHAALPWAAIRLLLQVSVNDVQMFGSLVEGMEVVCKTVARYAAIERLYFRKPSSIDKMLEDSIIATYASILRFLSKCRRHFDLGLTRRVARSITQLPETSVNKNLDRIAENDKRVSELTRIVDAEWSQLNHTQQLSARDGMDQLVHDLGQLRTESTDSASRLEALLRSFKEPLMRTVEQASTLSGSLVESRNESESKEERLAILQWLSNVRYRKHHQTLSKGLLEGTGQWLLQKPQFVTWRDSSVSSLLWLHGIPGSGKTCLMSTVIQQLLTETSTIEKAAPIVYFYCQRNTAEPQRSKPVEVLRAILKQLMCCQARWQTDSSTAKEYRRRKQEADKDGSEVERLDIAETTQNIIDAVAQMPVTILIDALDECRSDQRHQLLRALDDLLGKSAHLVKVFVSSRDDVDIVLRLQKHPNLYINIDDNKDDITRFIQAEIQQAQSDRRLLNGLVSAELKTLITKNLAMKAEGMFLWVSLQIESLCDSRRIKVEGDLVDELARLPRSLAGMYSLILENISQIEQRGRTVAQTTFKWLLCTNDAGSEVTVAACSETLSTEYRSISIREVLDVCSNLVVYDEALDTFRFAHLSVREFLESQPGYTPSEANRYVLERSLQTLTCIQPSANPFLFYATFHWITLYHRLEEQHRKEFFDVHAKRFLFNGAEPSDVFDIWATAVYRLNRDLLESESLPSLSGSIHSPVQGIRDRINHLYSFKECFRSPMVLASCFGWLEVLDHFETNQSPNDLHGPAMEMMTIAIQFGQISVVGWLFDRYFYPTDEHLNLAFNLRRSEIIQTFLDMKFLSLNTLVNDQEILVLAVRSSLADIYRELIKKGANIDCQDQSGRTLLSHAVSVSSNNSEIIEDLLLKGLDPIVQDNDGRTPLSLSIWGKYQPKHRLRTGELFESSAIISGEEVRWLVLQSSTYYTACLLLHYGLDSMLKDVDMRTEWMEVLTRIGSLPGLLSNTSNSSEKRFGNFENDLDDKMQLVGQTLLSLAALFRHERAFQVLLNWGIDPTCPVMCEVQTKTCTVAQMGRSIGREEALDPKCQSNTKKMSDELRQGPLAWAAFTGNLPLVQSILDRGMDPNIKNGKGQTPLYFAVQQTEDEYSRIDLETDKAAIVRLLLQNGVVAESADAHGGATLLAHAFKARYSKVAYLLLENGAEIPKGDNDGPMEQLWGAFNQGQEGIRRALLEKIRGAQAYSPDLQSSSSDFCWFGDPLGIAAWLIWGGTMRVLGDVLLTAFGDVEKSN